jgi:hypothetical protein
MLSKKWRTSHTGDEAFQDRILADFRAFCSNKDDRLKEYWNDYRLDNPVWYFKYILSQKSRINTYGDNQAE